MSEGGNARAVDIFTRREKKGKSLKKIENVNPDVFPSLSINPWQLFGSLSLPE